MEPSRTYVLVDFRCNNACVFCNQAQASGTQDSADDVVERVRALASEGVDSVTFCGGEATLDLARLEGLVAIARSEGIEKVGVQTNGRRLAYSNVVQRLVDAGVNRFDVSLHGSNADTHDWVTRVPGSFKQTIRGLREIRKAGAEITLHTVLLRSNFRQVREMVLLAAKLRVRSMNFRFVVPEGRILAEESFPSLVPKYSLVQPILMLANATAKRMGVSLYLHDFPDCVVGSLLPNIVRDKARWVGLEENVWLRSENEYGEECSSCAIKSECAGVSSAYLAYYGNEELLPFSQEAERESAHNIANAV